MQFKHLKTIAPGIGAKLAWLFYSQRTESFIFGDEKQAFTMDTMNFVARALPGTVADTGAVATHPCNLPIPVELYEDLSHSSWHGFRFLDRPSYDRATNAKGELVGDLLRTLVFLPDYGHYVLHPSSGMIFSLKSGSIEILRRDSEKFVSVEKTKTRGRAALAFAAHPTQNLIAYGDNAGTFHVQRFTPEGFGKASKVAVKERPASRVEFVDEGQMLVIGGMGYLETYSHAADKFAPLHQTSIAVRDFLWIDNGNCVLVNQGMHGITAYRYDSTGFAKIGAVVPGSIARQMALSARNDFLALSDQDSGQIHIFGIAQQ